MLEASPGTAWNELIAQLPVDADAPPSAVSDEDPAETEAPGPAGERADGAPAGESGDGLASFRL